MSYTGIGFVNDNPPAINAENLNKMDNEIYGLDQVLQKTKISTFYLGAVTSMNENISAVTVSAANNRLRSIEDATTANKKNHSINAGAVLHCNADKGYEYFVQFFRQDNGKNIFTNNFIGGENYYYSDYDCYVIIGCRKSDNSNISPTEVADHFDFHYTLKQFESVNDAIENIQADVTNIDSFIHSNGSIITTMLQGGFTNASQGSNISSFQTTDATNVIRSTSTSDRKNIVIPANKDIYISVDTGYRYAYQIYSSENNLGLDTFAWSTDEKHIKKTVDTYLIIMLSKVSQTAISTSEVNHLRVSYYEDPTIKEELENKVDFTKEQSLTTAQKELVQRNIGIEDAGELKITFPFTFDNGVNVYKHKDKYITDFIPGKKGITKTNGVVVFVSPNGNDENNGLTVSTPKKTLESALGISNVVSLILLQGTYTAGTHFTAGLSISKEINMIGIGNVVIDSRTGNPITFTKNSYVENVIFKGGNNAVISALESTSNYITFYRCKFCESYRLNGLAIQGGIAYIVECEANDNAYDGFNYHANNTVIALAMEIDCKAYNNGLINLSGTEGQSSNGSTGHDGSKIIRINGEYSVCHGGVVADKDCNSANYGSSAGISTVTDANYPDKMSNYWCSGGSMWLYDCISYASKYDTAVINSGTIISDIQYPSKYPS